MSIQFDINNFIYALDCLVIARSFCALVYATMFLSDTDNQIPARTLVSNPGEQVQPIEKRDFRKTERKMLLVRELDLRETLTLATIFDDGEVKVVSILFIFPGRTLDACYVPSFHFRPCPSINL